MTDAWTVAWPWGVLNFLDVRECAALARSNRLLRDMVQKHVPKPHQLHAKILNRMMQCYRKKRRTDKEKKDKKRKRSGGSLWIAHGETGGQLRLRLRAKMRCLGSEWKTEFEGRLEPEVHPLDSNRYPMLMFYNQSNEVIMRGENLLSCSRVFAELEQMIETLLDRAMETNLDNIIECCHESSESSDY